MALVCGLRGEEKARAWWLAALAVMRGVEAGRAAHGSGYGELFEATVLLHHGQPRAALDMLNAAPDVLAALGAAPMAGRNK